MAVHPLNFQDRHPLSCGLKFLCFILPQTFSLKIKTKITFPLCKIAVPIGRAVKGVGLRPLACCDRVFELHRVYGCLFVVRVVCCQVEVSATSWSLVQRSPTDCGASFCVMKKPREQRVHSLRWASVTEKIITLCQIILCDCITANCIIHLQNMWLIVYLQDVLGLTNRFQRRYC
jgi:hypothetical protein